MDYNYKNKEGISVKDILDIFTNNEQLSKKEIITAIKAKKSIDTILKKMIENNILNKITEKRSVFYSKKIDKDITVEKILADKDITKVINATNTNSKSLSKPVDQEALDLLKETIEQNSGKEITAILHKRHEKKEIKKDNNVSKIYNTHKDEEYVINTENPYRFVLNFFNTTLNNELATGYFRRRDNYVVKSIYNKFKTMCKKVDTYDIDGQHQPFYRVFTINKNDLTVKIYHIDMNRMIRGSYTLFVLNTSDSNLIFEYDEINQGE